MVLVELAFLHFGVELVVAQDQEDGADVLDVEGGVFREHYDVVEDANGGKVFCEVLCTVVQSEVSLVVEMPREGYCRT